MCALMGSIIPSRLGCCIDFSQNIRHLVREAGPRWIPFGQADDSGSVGSGLALLVFIGTFCSEHRSKIRGRGDRKFCDVTKFLVYRPQPGMKVETTLSDSSNTNPLQNMALATAPHICPYGARASAFWESKECARDLNGLNSFSPRYLLLSGVFRRGVQCSVYWSHSARSSRDCGPLSKHHFGGR